MLAAVAAVLVALPAAAHAAPPVATIAGPTAAVTGQPADFDASASSDPDGEPLRFAWSIDGQDVGIDDAWLSVAFSRPGRHVVVVTVTDRSGDVDQAVRVVQTTGPVRGNVSPLPKRLPSVGAIGAPTLVLAPARDRLRHGRLRLTVRCAGTTRCRGVLRATVIRRGRLRLLGQRRFDLPRGGPTVVRLKLGPRGRRRLGRGTRVRVAAYRGAVARDAALWDAARYRVDVRRRASG